MIVDLACIEPRDGTGREDILQDVRPGLGQFVQDERGAFRGRKRREHAGAGGWLKHTVGRAKTGRAGDGEGERQGR